jgi:hypothetical protein
MDRASHAVIGWQHPLAGLTVLLLMEFGDFVVRRRMLRGIKARAEPPAKTLRPSRSSPERREQCQPTQQSQT